MAGFNDEELEQLQTFFESSERRMEERLKRVIKDEVAHTLKQEVRQVVKQELASALLPVHAELKGIRDDATTDRKDAREDVDSVVSQYVDLDTRVKRVEKVHELETVSVK